jgi:hypothetical protein
VLEARREAERFVAIIEMGISDSDGRGEWRVIEANSCDRGWRTERSKSRSCKQESWSPRAHLLSEVLQDIPFPSVISVQNLEETIFAYIQECPMKELLLRYGEQKSNDEDVCWAGAPSELI